MWFWSPGGGKLHCKNDTLCLDRIGFKIIIKRYWSSNFLVHTVFVETKHKITCDRIQSKGLVLPSVARSSISASSASSPLVKLLAVSSISGKTGQKDLLMRVRARDDALISDIFVCPPPAPRTPSQLELSSFKEDISNSDELRLELLTASFDGITKELTACPKIPCLRRLDCTSRHMPQRTSKRRQNRCDGKHEN